MSTPVYDTIILNRNRAVDAAYTVFAAMNDAMFDTVDRAVYQAVTQAVNAAVRFPIQQAIREARP